MSQETDKNNTWGYTQEDEIPSAQRPPLNSSVSFEAWPSNSQATEYSLNFTQDPNNLPTQSEYTPFASSQGDQFGYPSSGYYDNSYSTTISDHYSFMSRSDDQEATQATQQLPDPWSTPTQCQHENTQERELWGRGLDESRDNEDW